ncbi:hypothetical protein LXL04_017906 [Taraxacum kok-saghyz]
MMSNSNTTMSLRKGSKVWLEDKDTAWAAGEVNSFAGKQVQVITESGKQVLTFASKLLLRDGDAEYGGVDNMTKLAYLNEPGVLDYIKKRYALNEIYTYIGSILIAVNPFTKLPHLHNVHMMEQYNGAPFGELNPHVFAIADASYRAMINEGKSQSILVSGESGAGKTETTKLIMQYLTYVGGCPVTVTDDATVEQRLLESNPLLEAFGNAHTLRNDNSSRFGKFVEIQFDSNCRISGAAIRTYLLERSRVVQTTDSERNYHCFYQLCASGRDADVYKLGHPTNFHYLNQSSVYEWDGESSAEEYMKTRRAMDVFGISCEEQEAIFRTLAAILHLGNVEFKAGRKYDSSQVKDAKSNFHLQMAAALFECDVKNLIESLCTRSIQTREGIIFKALDCEAAVASRDVLAKTVYARLFDWLVEYVNRSVGQDHNSRMQIGILDIYGFECFKHNSFEQFCINFANEKLQHHFNEHVFKMEQEEYTKEQITWSYIELIDNQDVLDLIEKKRSGVIALLDEACIFQKTHETFANKLFQSLRAHPRFGKAKFSETEFTISHYAGKVNYQTDSFVAKNRDYVVIDHCNLMSSSNSSFIAALFPPLPKESSRPSYKFSSVASRFKQQLQALMDTLSSTESRYVRCVKPNSVNRPQKFENQSVLHQLRCGGVLEAVRISLAGYPTRKTYHEFVDRFGLIAMEVMDGSYDERAMTKKILEKLKLENYQLGKTKVFLRAGQIGVLDSQRAGVLDSAAKRIQLRMKTFIAHKDFTSKRKAAISFQAYCWGYLARAVYGAKRECAAAVLIQKYSRGWMLKNTYTQKYLSAVLLQASVRGFITRQRFLHIREHTAATVIQARWRSYKIRSTFRTRVHDITKIQCFWRRKLAKRELRKLKQEANETGALHLPKTKLEKQLEGLTWRLQLEKKIKGGSADESKYVEIAKLKKTMQSLVLELDAAKLATVNECNKNKVLQNQLELSVNEKSSLERELVGMADLRNENSYLKSSLSTLEEKNSTLQTQFTEAKEDASGNLKKLREVEKICSLLQHKLKSFEEKLASLMKENHDLRQNTLSATSKGSWPSNTKPFLEENYEILARCIKENVRFKDGKPIAATVIYKCLVHWHAFESERTAIFDFIIENINNVLKVGDEGVTLPYWLSNASALLCLWQRNFRSNAFLTPQHIYIIDYGFSSMEARYPAILFNQQLTACVEKIFGLIRDNLKKEISPLLNSCIQAPKNQRVHGGKPSRSPSGIPQQAAGSQWEKIIEFLDSLMDRLRNNHVPSFFIRKFTTQVFTFLNISLFNSLLLRRECCTFSNGEYVKSGLAELEKWIANAKEEFAGTSWHELNYIRQAVGFLVIHQKINKSLDEIRHDICPALTVGQIYHISSMYWDEKYGTPSVSNEVVGEMREMLNKDSPHLNSYSFLLDDDQSIPSSMEDIYMANPGIDLTDIDPPMFLSKYPSTQFLLPNPK